jgi:hypothetical protein
MITKLRYEVGAHVLEVTGNGGRWTTTVDGVVFDRWFTSSADAWTAGVAEALRLDADASFMFVGSAGAGQQA